MTPMVVTATRLMFTPHFNCESLHAARPTKMPVELLLIRDGSFQFLPSHKVGQFQAKITWISGVSHTNFVIDDPFSNQPFDFAIEVLHAFGRADAHCVQQCFALAFTLLHVLAGAQS